MNYFLLLFFFIVAYPAPAKAQCTNPAGVPGEREWFTGENVYKVCTTTGWKDFSCVGSNAGCIPSSISYASKLSSNPSSPTDANISDDGNTLYVLRKWGAGISIFDVSGSPSAPTFVGSVSNGSYSDGNRMARHGNTIFSTSRYWNGGGGLISTDVSNPASPGLLDTFLPSPNDEMYNLWGVAITDDGQHAVTASFQSGSNNDCHVHVIDVSNPSSMSEVGHIDFSGVSGAGVFCNRVEISGDYAFLSFADDGFGVVDISTPSSPNPVAYLSLGSGQGDGPTDLALSEDGQWAFTSNRFDDSLSSFDISDPLNPAFSDRVVSSSLNEAYNVEVRGNIAIVLGNITDCAVLYDISDPSNITYIDEYCNTPNLAEPYAIAIHGQYVYSGAYDGGGVAVLDLGCDVGGGSSPVTCTSLGSCSNPAVMDWDVTEAAYRVCDGSDWVEIRCEGSCCPSLGACPAGSAGAIDYDADILQYCDGTNWHALHVNPVPTGCPNIGDICCDGSVYAGLSPDGNVPMYTTPADAPGLYNFNDGTFNSNDTAVVNCTASETGCRTGEANTTILAGLGTGPSPAPYEAARYCDGLSQNGHDDWYLPAKDELGVIYSNRSVIPGLDLSGSFWDGHYWSSSERVGIYSWSYSMDYGPQSNGAHTYSSKVRCVRK